MMERPLFSEILTSRRRELGYSIGQASRVLRLKEDVLIAFEEGDFGSMPKSGYAQGMLASYARYLGLDATEICDIYIEDLDSYRHGRKSQNAAYRGPGDAMTGRSQSPSIGQPYVAKRGLLPTSGGVAGDLGSFATTRVRSREQYADERDVFEEDDGSLHVEYPQGRPYTGRTPTRTGRERAGGRRSRVRGDVDTMSPSDYEYEDDLRFGRDVRSYEAASTGRGRRRTRRSGDRQRPSVRRRARTGSASSRRDGRRGARGGGSGRRSRRGSQQSRPNRTLMLVIGAVVILSVIIIFTAVSCIRQGSDETRTVPVSSTESNAQNNTQASTEKSQDGKGQASEKEGTSEQGATTGSSAHTGGSQSTSNSATTGKNNSTEKETSVSVSVNDGEVTWLEIECDGKSDVAETITGPWQKTYTVTDSMTIQAGETSSVAVVQNGRQLQFESITAGIGTLRIQGTKKTEKSSDSKSDGKEKSSKDATSNGSEKSGSDTSDSAEGESVDSSANTTIDGVTYDVYGNVVSNETGGVANANANDANGTGATGTRANTTRSSGR